MNEWIEVFIKENRCIRIHQYFLIVANVILNSKQSMNIMRDQDYFLITVYNAATKS